MKSLSPLELKEFDASLKGGRKTKRRGNASLKAWVTFVKKVAKEEKLSYKDAMMRAKVRKDKGEKWMKGGNEMSDMMVRDEMAVEEDMEMPLVEEEMDMDVTMEKPEMNMEMGGRRHRRKGKSHKKHGGAKKRGTKKRR